MDRERRASTKSKTAASKSKTAASRAQRMPSRRKAPADRTIPSFDPAAPYWEPFDHQDVRAILVLFGDDMLATVSAAQAATLLANADPHFVSRPSPSKALFTNISCLSG